MTRPRTSTSDASGSGPRRLAVAVIVAAALYGVVGCAGSSDGCPRGTSYLNTTLVEICDRPDGATACVISAAGFSRTTDADVPLVGPWCGKEH